MNIAGPLQKIQEPALSDLAKVDWPDPEDPGRVRGLRQHVEDIRRGTDCAVVLNLGNATFALSQRLRGFAELLEDLLLNRVFAEALMERVTDVVYGIAENALREVGDLVDCVFSADDLGIQTQSFMRPELYHSLVKPHHKRLFQLVRERTGAWAVLHSDGAIYALLPDILDCGVQVINPVQTSAVGMEPERLKQEFGNDLSFWGGIDTHDVLPHGSPEEVAEEVRRRRHDLGRGGGYVLASVHNIQAEVPPENVVAMFEAAMAGAN
jgi:uroporphyrinogen decarboxylase